MAVRRKSSRRRPNADRGSLEYAAGRHQATSDMWGGGSPGIREVKRAVSAFKRSPGSYDAAFVLGYLEAGKEIIAGTHELSSRGSYGEPKGRRSNTSPMLGWTGKTEAARAEHRRQSLASYFRVKPKRNYKLLGTGAVLDKSKPYWAMNATNQPDWQPKGLIFLQMNPDGSPATKAKLDFADGFLLEKGDYTKVRSKRRSKASPRRRSNAWATAGAASEYVVCKVGESWQVQRDGKTVGGKRYLYKAEAVAAAPPGAVILTSKGKLPKRRKNPCGLQHRRPNKLTRVERVTLSDSAFAIPKERKFPIQNKRQAVTALTYATWPENQKYRKRVEAAVYKRYPSLKPTPTERREHHVVPPGASRALPRKTYLRKPKSTRRTNPYGTIVLEASTKGGKHKFKVGRTGSGSNASFNLTQYTSGRESGHGSGYTKVQMIQRVNELIYWAKEIDGISYKVTKDKLRKKSQRVGEVYLKGGARRTNTMGLFPYERCDKKGMDYSEARDAQGLDPCVQRHRILNAPKRRRNVTLHRTTKGKLTKRAELVAAFRRLEWVVDTSHSKNVYVYEPPMLGWTGKSAATRAEHRRQSLALTTLRYKIGPKSVRAQQRDSVPTDLRPGGSHPWYNRGPSITLSEALRRIGSR